MFVPETYSDGICVFCCLRIFAEKPTAEMYRQSAVLNENPRCPYRVRTTGML